MNQGIPPGDPMAPTVSSTWKWWICILLLLATTLNYMDRQALYQTSVRISRDFGLTNTEYGQIEAIFNIGFGLGALTVGWLVDRGNVRWIYALIVFAWSMVGFGTGFVTSFTMLIICRFLLGLFEAGNWPCGILTVKRVLKPEQRSLGNGMFQSGTALGAIITPLVVLACISYADPQEPDRTALQFVTGGSGVLAYPNPQYAWQLPFRVIGLLGVVWVILWLVTVRSHHVAAPPPTASDPTTSDSYWDIWKNRRFWILVVVILSVNITWRSFGGWLPKFLQEGRGYSESTMQWFMSLYYLGADAGSILVGFVTLALVRAGWRLHASRLFIFAFCASLSMLSLVAATLPQGQALLIVLLLIGFGTLGLFPTYFALSQEISSKHQGKVTGTLGCINALGMAILFPLQGILIDQTKSFSIALGLAGIPPMIAVIVVFFFWKSDPPK